MHFILYLKTHGQACFTLLTVYLINISTFSKIKVSNSAGQQLSKTYPCPLSTVCSTSLTHFGHEMPNQQNQEQHSNQPIRFEGQVYEFKFRLTTRVRCFYISVIQLSL